MNREKHVTVKSFSVKGLVGIAFMVLLSLTGCTHALRITNAADYIPAPNATLKQTVRVGVSSSSDLQLQNKRYVSAVVEALKHNVNIGSVVYPFNAATNRNDADIAVDITVSPQYDGRGSNFFVNWPGFLIFAPAIWGYGYEAQIDTSVNVTNLKENTSQLLAIPSRYEFRHADMGRTWTEVGWFEVGIIPLVGGFVFTGYDMSATDEFIGKVSPYYGPYVASKIMTAIGALSANAPSPIQATTAGH